MFDLLVERGWCEQHQLPDEAHRIYLLRRDEYQLSFQEILFTIINVSYDDFYTYTEGHVNQNRETAKLTSPFPGYLQKQIQIPYGMQQSIEYIKNK